MQEAVQPAPLDMRYERPLDKVWCDFKKWVQETYPKEWAIRDRAVFSLKGEVAACCTPAAVSNFYDSLATWMRRKLCNTLSGQILLRSCLVMLVFLGGTQGFIISPCQEKLLEEVGLLKNGRLTDAAGTALWACDEKGLESTDGKVKFHRVAAPKAVGQATAEVCSSSWGHVTLLPFVSLDGHVGPPNVILQGSSFMKSWQTVWPEANIASNEKGSCTADLFSQFVLLWAKHCREVLKVPESQQLVLVCDSGGGSLVHLSTQCTLVCHKLGVRLYLLGPYLTKAVMCLDQTPNCEAERKWQRIRREAMPATQLEVLDAAHEIWEYGYNKEHIIAGWKRIGFVHKCAVNRNVVLVDRHCELFRKTVSASEMSVKEKESALLLARPQGYVRGKCQAACEQCLKMTPTSLPLCGHCGSKNLHYSPKKAAIAAGAKAGGFCRKQEPLVDVQSVIDEIPETTKANLSKFCGDVIGQMRKRKHTPEADIQPPTDVATPAKKRREAEGPQPAPLAPSSSSNARAEPQAAGVPEEFDLEDPASAVQYLALHWGPNAGKPDLLATLDFYVSSLKSKATKSQPLSTLITKEVIQTKMLYTRKQREGFLDSWKKNRAHRFAPKPRFVA